MFTSFSFVSFSSFLCICGQCRVESGLAMFSLYTGLLGQLVVMFLPDALEFSSELGDLRLELHSARSAYELLSQGKYIPRSSSG